MSKMFNVVAAAVAAATVLAPPAAHAKKPPVVVGGQHVISDDEWNGEAWGTPELTYQCSMRGSTATCTGSTPTGVTAKWSKTEVAPNRWTAKGKIGPNRLAWTVIGTTEGSPDGINYGAPHVQMQGSVTQSRGTAFTYSYGQYQPGGRRIGTTDLSGGYPGISCSTYVDPELGADCTVMSSFTVSELVVLAPVYPGVQPVFS